MMITFYTILTIFVILILFSFVNSKKKIIPFLFGPLLVLFVYYNFFIVDFMRSEPIHSYPDLNKEYIYVWHRVTEKNQIILWAINKKNKRDALYLFPYTRKLNEQLERAKNGVKTKGKKQTVKFKIDPRKENSIRVEIRDKQVKTFKGIRKTGDQIPDTSSIRMII